MSVTLDSLLSVTKALTGTVGAAVTGLVATGTIPVPDSWRGALTAAGVALTGFSVWLASNKSQIEAGVTSLDDSVGDVFPEWDPEVDRFLSRESAV